MHDFQNYQSKFATGFKISYEDNGYGTGPIMCVNPQYKNIEAMQFINDNYDDIKSFIESKTTLLSDIHQIDDSPCMDYPIICVFDTNVFNTSYRITIHPGDYLIWDEEIHRFIVLQESVFLTLYREA